MIGTLITYYPTNVLNIGLLEFPLLVDPCFLVVNTIICIPRCDNRAPLAHILFNATFYKFVMISPRKAGIVFHLQRLQLRIEVVIESFSFIFRTSRVSKTATQ